MKREIRVGFLGVAHFHAESYARALNEFSDAELAGVYDHDEKLGKEFARKFQTSYARTPEQLIDSDLDAVIVTAETSLHYPLLGKAEKAGKQILCEKPITLTEKQAEAVLGLAKKLNLTFQMCYVMRYHSTVKLAKEAIDEGRIGDVVSIVGNNKLSSALPLGRRWFTTRTLSGGGAVMDHTVHLADLMRWFTRSEAKEVYTEIGKNVNRKIAVEDNFFTTMTFQNGTIGHIDGSWSYASGYYTWGDVFLEILGTKGMILLDAFRQNVYLVGSDGRTNRLSWQYYGCDPDREMVRGFIDAIKNHKRPIASGEDGLQGLRITLASYESARTAKPVAL